MKSVITNAGHGRHRAGGFSMIEMIMVIAVGIVMVAVATLKIEPLLAQQHVTNAYNTTLAAMRQARDNAVSQQTPYSVTFATGSIPNTITVNPTLTGTSAFQGEQSPVTYALPLDVTFQTNTAIGSTAAPDSFGSGSNAIDFGYTASSNSGGQSTVYFCPDGSAQTASTCLGMGNWDNGVVYLAGSNGLLSSRAITLWGATGRIHGWRLYPNGSGVYIWVRQ